MSVLVECIFCNIGRRVTEEQLRVDIVFQDIACPACFIRVPLP